MAASGRGESSDYATLRAQIEVGRPLGGARRGCGATSEAGRRMIGRKANRMGMKPAATMSASRAASASCCSRSWRANSQRIALEDDRCPDDPEVDLDPAMRAWNSAGGRPCLRAGDSSPARADCRPACRRSTHSSSRVSEGGNPVAAAPRVAVDSPPQRDRRGRARRDDVSDGAPSTEWRVDGSEVARAAAARWWSGCSALEHPFQVLEVAGPVQRTPRRARVFSFASSR